MSINLKEYNEHQKIIKMVSVYEEWKHKVIKGSIKTVDTFYYLVNFIENYESECRAPWSEFITQYRFVTHINITNATRYITSIIPDVKDIMNPIHAFNGGEKPAENLYLGYDFRDKIIFRRNYNTLMIDFDFEEGFGLQEIMNKIEDIVETGKIYNLFFTFALLRTDRGIHAYLVSHEYERTNGPESLLWVDFLRVTCNDPYYTAFTYDLGFGTRLNKKEKNDIVLWIHPFDDKDSFFSKRVDVGSYKFNFQSNYYDYMMEINYPSSVKIVGDTQNIKQDLIKNLYIDYMLSQYLKKLDTDLLETHIYEPFIYPFHKENIHNLREDIYMIIDHIDKYIDQINDMNTNQYY